MKRGVKIILTVIVAVAALVFSSGNPIKEQVENCELEVHFIDVGQADSALLISGGEAMLIDGGNADDSSLLYSYLTDCGIERLEYIIGTHAHEDHIGGIPGAMARAEVGKIFTPKIGNDARFYEKFIKMAEEKGIEVTAPRGDEVLSLGSCEVALYTPDYVDYEEINNTSIMARVSCGDVSFLFTGDAERDAEEDILSQGVRLDATVLKVGHHGSDTSSSYPFLREVMPEIAVISVGEDNPYSHPHEGVLSRLDDLGAKVYRTDKSGHIVIKTDGEAVSVEQKKKEVIKEETSTDGAYIGNINSKKLHLPSCSGLPKEENRVYFENREDAVSLGYTPCKSCNP